ncbi:Plasmodium exported protein (PHIST), unknown function [Plasmodium ovale wallikeri]|uniref:Plasmodium RESA N-terminal domain-containing protein n=2 Tax=Plasmodium ovale TaxID=36330 RepID=A0A1A8YM57_PLAOA|nr:Plasmodium exported protein (PHIST), unknown function [Plasmodium ovale wallikeri]SBT56152.1 Plasmodium exported protein (PHIST), unknown function [Plasmodium ovale wallikeri]SBT73398.1 Plasmodium exported protein (PHIST), unknown function [Plasmodium ovale]
MEIFSGNFFPPRKSFPLVKKCGEKGYLPIAERHSIRKRISKEYNKKGIAKCEKNNFSPLALYNALLFVILFFLLQCNSEDGHVHRSKAETGRERVRKLGEVYHELQRFYDNLNRETSYERLFDDDDSIEYDYLDKEEYENDRVGIRLRTYDDIYSNRKKQSIHRYGNCPYGCKDSDLVGSISEEELENRLNNLSTHVNSKEMFILWNYVNDHERKKFMKMIENLKKYCENLANTYDIPYKVKNKEWMKAYRNITRLYLRNEKRFRRNFYYFLKRGTCERGRFVNVINRVRSAWSTGRKETNIFWRSMLTRTLSKYWNRNVVQSYHSLRYY